MPFYNQNDNNKDDEDMNWSAGGGRKSQETKQAYAAPAASAMAGGGSKLKMCNGTRCVHDITIVLSPCYLDHSVRTRVKKTAPGGHRPPEERYVFWVPSLLTLASTSLVLKTYLSHYSKRRQWRTTLIDNSTANLQTAAGVLEGLLET
jgi:hypothetical protein